MIVCVGLKQAVVCVSVLAQQEPHSKMPLPALRPLVTGSPSDRRPSLGLESSYPWGFLPEVLRMLLGQTQAVPQEAMLGPHQGLSQKQGPGVGGATCPLPKPLSHWPHCILAGFPF